MSDFNDSLNDVSSDSFWEVGNYKRAVKRVDDGHRLCNDLMNCLHERAKIEKAYAAQLSDWAKRWRQLVEKGPQYGTVEQAWCSLMTEAEKVSDLHLDIRAALMAEDFEKVKNWQKEAYHKQMIGGFKETKEADDGFRKAQKPWAKKLKEVDGMKKNYHAACKEEKLATSRENSGKLENNNPEVQKKLQEKVEKCQQDVEKSKERYDKSLDELEKLTPQYMENMEQVFEQWQEFEDKRLVFFRELLLDVKQHLDLSTNHMFMSVYRTLEASIKGADPHEDLRWFRSTHGPGMCMNWPQFEEWSVDLNRTLSRRDTRRKHTDEVTLTAISQSRDSVQKSSPSAAAGAESAVCLNPFDEDEDEEETPVERRESSPVNVNAEEVVSQTVAHLDVSDEDAANPFTSANGNPFEGRSTPEVSVRVQALYDYEGQEQDELSFRAGDEFLKTGEEDEQGWCKGRLANGTVGLYPANYVRNI